MYELIEMVVAYRKSWMPLCHCGSTCSWASQSSFKTRGCGGEIIFLFKIIELIMVSLPCSARKIFCAYMQMLIDLWNKSIIEAYYMIICGLILRIENRLKTDSICCNFLKVFSDACTTLSLFSSSLHYFLGRYLGYLFTFFLAHTRT